MSNWDETPEKTQDTLRDYISLLAWAAVLIASFPYMSSNSLKTFYWHANESTTFVFFYPFVCFHRSTLKNKIAL